MRDNVLSSLSSSVAVRPLCRLDALVLNHAAFQDSLLLEYADTAALAAELRRLCEVNIVGIMVAAMKALPLLHATGGRLVFVSSGSTIVAPPFHTAYGARSVRARACGSVFWFCLAATCARL